jgi:hypothetical protein
MTQNRNLSILADNVNSSGVLAVAGGGTGLSSTPANGQIDIGNGSGFTRSTLTAGSGVSIANTSGVITISATGTGGTVTSITAGTNLTGGTITSAGTIALAGTINSVAIGATTPSTGAFTYISTNSSTSTTPVLSFDGANTALAQSALVAGSYLQDIIQNRSGGVAGSSTNYVVSNNIGTDSSYYGEFGINSSVFSSGTPSDFYSINNGVYFSGHDGDISVGSGNGYKTYLTWGTAGQSAHVINAAGAIGFSTNLGSTVANTGTIGYGTSGALAVTQGSGGPAAWSTNLTWDNVNYRLGIGTASPAYALEVTTAVSFNSSNSVNPSIIFGGNGSTLPASGFGGAIGYNFVSGQGEVDFWNIYPSASRSFSWYQLTGTGTTSSLLASLLPSGNFGIGTASPAYPLDVVGTINSTTQILNSVSQSPYTATPLFGTGADGAVTISSGTTTLTRDMHYTNLTISGTGALKPAGFQVFVSGTLDISAAPAGAIIANGSVGNAGSGSSGGIFSGNGTISSSGASVPMLGGASGNAGAAGSIAVGAQSVGSAYTGNIFQIGGNPGVSGAGGAGVSAGGASASISAISTTTAQFTSPIGSFALQNTTLGSLGSLAVQGTAATGGGGGGGDGINAGGGGGAGGGGSGYLVIRARFIQRGTNVTTSIFQAKGGIGGAGASSSAGNTGGGGGGGAGGGGFVYIVTEQLLGTAITNAIDVSGGTGGTGGNGFGTGKGGNGGTGGNGGNYQIVVLNPASFTVGAFNTAGTAGSTTTTTTGAAGGAGATVRGNL